MHPDKLDRLQHMNASAVYATRENKSFALGESCHNRSMQSKFPPLDMNISVTNS